MRSRSSSALATLHTTATRQPQRPIRRAPVAGSAGAMPGMKQKHFYVIFSTLPLPPATAYTSRISTTYTSISGAGRCGRSLSRKPPGAQASLVSSARQATLTATPFPECVSTCVECATRYGFLTLAERVVEHTEATTSLLFRRPLRLLLPSVHPRRIRLHQPLFTTPASKGRAKKSLPALMP